MKELLTELGWDPKLAKETAEAVDAFRAEDGASGPEQANTPIWYQTCNVNDAPPIGYSMSFGD